MDIKQLRYFVRIVELGSFTKASEDLGVAQPALTYQIQKLEEEVNVELLHRHRRGVGLTDAGRLLLRKATGILEEAEQTVNELRALSAVPTGRIVLALPPSAARILLPDLVQIFHAAYPDVYFTVREGYTGHIFQWLVEGAVDLAISTEIESRTKFEAMPLYRDRLHLIGAGTTPSGDGSSIAMKDLSGLPLVIATHSHGGRRSVERAVSDAGGALSVKVEADSVEALKQLLLAGFGMTVMPRVLCQREIQEGSLWALEIREPAMVRAFGLVRPRDRPKSLALQELQRILVEQVQRAIAQGYWEQP